MKKQLPLIIILGLLLLGAAGVAVAMMTGYLTITVKEPSQNVAVRAQVCGDDVVSKYNAAIKADNLDTYKSQLKTVFEDVDKRAGKEDDATCAFVVYRYYLYENQTEQVNSAVENLKKLSDEGAFPSNKLADPQSIEQIEARASIIDGNIESTDAGGAG